jgi:hypothetical protein
MKLWVSLVVAMLVLGCGGPPPRPANVPAESFFVGKRKDGVFVRIGARDGLGWQIKIYDPKGNLKREGAYVLRGMARAEIVPDEVLSYDGEALHLRDGTLLIPRR